MTNTKRFGPFVLLDLIGKGGMAEVFLAMREEDKRYPPKLFALKRLLPLYSSQRDFVQRLIDEAKVCSVLNYPAIVKTFELNAVGVDFYVCMEWVEGKSLDHVFRRLQEQRRSFPRAPLLYIMNQAARALHFAHSAVDSAGRPLGIVHCDVTPGNILLGYDGSVKLTDFGIARAERVGTEQNRQAAFGKLSYMSPEQITGKLVDRRSDIYGLGVLLYEGICFQTPFRASSAIELQQLILKRDATFEGSAWTDETDLINLLTSALAKEPSKRPATALDFTERLPYVDEDLGRSEIALLLTELFVREQNDEIKRHEAALAEIRVQTPAPRFPAGKGEETEPPWANEKTEWKHAGEEPETTRVTPVTNFEQPRQELGRIDLRKQTVARVVPAENPPIEEAPSIPEIETKPNIPNPFYTPPPYSPPRSISKTSSFRMVPSQLPLIGKIVGIGAVALTLVFSLGYAIRWFNHPKSVSRGTVSEMDIYMTIEKSVSNEDQKELSRWILPGMRDEIWFHPLNRFFAREFKRLTGITTPPFVLKYREPKLETHPIDWQGSFFHPMLAFTELSEELGVPNAETQPGVGRLFIHIYSKKLEEPPRYPLDYQNERPASEGVVYLSLNRQEYLDSLVRVAHEMGHVLGATDKYDKNNLAVFPDGFTEPLKNPLYPQSKAELMTRGILLTAMTHRPIASLDEVHIGYRTAAEIGWIQKSKADEFYAVKK